MTLSSPDKIAKAAEILYTSRINAIPITTLPDALQPADIDQSYALQEQLNRQLAATALHQPVGFKIGCTTAVMQQYLMINHPCKGAIFKSTLLFGHGRFASQRLCRPGVECEVAVKIAHDMHAGTTYTVENCHPFIESCFASIELVDDRWRDYTRVPATTLIAENFFGAGCVLGDPASVSADALHQTQGTMWVNGEKRGSGRGSDILGHPLAALVWLANHQAERGTPLKAGDYVSLGSVVQTQWLNQGDKVEIEFTSLGGCSLQLD